MWTQALVRRCRSRCWHPVRYAAPWYSAADEVPARRRIEDSGLRRVDVRLVVRVRADARGPAAPVGRRAGSSCPDVGGLERRPTVATTPGLRHPARSKPHALPVLPQVRVDLAQSGWARELVAPSAARVTPPGRAPRRACSPRSSARRCCAGCPRGCRRRCCTCPSSSPTRPPRRTSTRLTISTCPLRTGGSCDVADGARRGSAGPRCRPRGCRSGRRACSRGSSPRRPWSPSARSARGRG